MFDFKIVSRPWEPQDLLDDLQLLIDEESDNYLNGRRTTLCMARDYLHDFFSADVVSVVRCKDCKHYRPQNISTHWAHSKLYCMRSASVKMPPNGFCCYGERNEPN